MTSSLKASSLELLEDAVFRNVLIADKILSFLPLDTLKAMREVSSFYNHQAVKEMFRNYYLPLYNNLSLNITLEGFLAHMQNTHGDYIKFRNIKIFSPHYNRNEEYNNHFERWDYHYDEDIEDLLPHLALYGHNVRELIYNATPTDSQISKFCSTISQLPNLKVLSLSSLLLDPSHQSWPLLFGLFQQLEKLTIERVSPQALEYFIKLKQQAPKSIQKLLPGVGNWSPEVGDGHVPRGSLVGGRDVEIGQNLIVARSYHPNGDLLPGKLVAAQGVNYAPWNTQAHAMRRYETLIVKENEVQWVGASSGEVVPGAVVGGMTNYGERLYVGRAVHNGSVHLGKIHRSHRVLYIAYDGREIPYANYESLVLKSAL